MTHIPDDVRMAMYRTLVVTRAACRSDADTNADIDMIWNWLDSLLSHDTPTDAMSMYQHICATVDAADQLQPGQEA